MNQFVELKSNVMSELTDISNPVYHIPAMLGEVLDGLCIDACKPQVFVDATFGGGGHSRGIAERMGKQSRLYGIDQDLDAYANRIDDERFTFVRSNFRYVANFMDYYGVIQVDGILADLGVSFHHFDAAERGFSFRYDAPLDMRMNAKQRLSAADIINGYSEEELARVLYLYGEFNNSRAIAAQIIRKRAQGAIQTTQQLQDCVRLKDKQDYARLFQALRIEVNDELGALRELLQASVELLAPGGRVVILTYHSLEDRIVKNEKGRTASAEEVARNPRARSAKLRVAEKIANAKNE